MHSSTALRSWRTCSFPFENRPQESCVHQQDWNFTSKILCTSRLKLYLQDWNFTVSWVEGQEEHQQVPDKLSRLVSSPRRIWDFYRHWHSDIFGSCSASGDLRLWVCHPRISPQCNTRTHGSWRHPETIARRRLQPSRSCIKSANFHMTMSTLSTNESDQTVSRSEEIFYGSVIPIPSDLYRPYWPTSERRGRIPVHPGSDLCVLTLDRTFSN